MPRSWTAGTNVALTLDCSDSPGLHSDWKTAEGESEQPAQDYKARKKKKGLQSTLTNPHCWENEGHRVTSLNNMYHSKPWK